MKNALVEDDCTKYKETNLLIVWPLKASMLVMLFTERNEMFTNQIITNYTLTVSINVMTLAVDA